MQHDFQPPRTTRLYPRRRRPRRHLLFLVLFLFGCTSVAMLLFSPSYQPLEARQEPVQPLPQVSAVPVPQQRVLERRVEVGDTLTSMLGDYLSVQEIQSLGVDSRKVFPLTQIVAGQPYQLELVDDQFERFVYEISREEQLVIRREQGALKLKRVAIEYEIRPVLIHGVVESSLFAAVSAIDEQPELAVRLADIFAWDIDFIKDVRRGDRFTALVEKRYRKGKIAGYGRILAAEFINKGTRYAAYYFADGKRPGSYYDADGSSLRKAFLKAPLDFTRISSGFTFKRFHPITKTWKAHPAIDYAAPTGTPIKTVGDGVISRFGRTRGNGNYIEVRHNGGYKTLYLHMSKFAQGMRKGKRVVQGQVIGYVGQTGLATGPHLCFRMKKNNRPVNPYKVKAPAAKPVSSASRSEFRQLVSRYRAKLQGRDLIRTAALPSDSAD